MKNITIDKRQETLKHLKILICSLSSPLFHTVELGQLSFKTQFVDEKKKAKSNAVKFISDYSYIVILFFQYFKTPMK